MVDWCDELRLDEISAVLVAVRSDAAAHLPTSE